MEVREFFKKAKKICERDMNWCETCPITEYCSDGIFSSVEAEIEDLIEIVEMEDE